jgi:hypothetical protein
MKRLACLLFLVLIAAGASVPPQAPAAPALQVKATPVQVGGSIFGPQNPSGWATWEAAVSGGTPPYQYAWMWTIEGDGYAEGEYWHGSFYARERFT